MSACLAWVYALSRTDLLGDQFIHYSLFQLLVPLPVTTISFCQLPGTNRFIHRVLVSLSSLRAPNHLATWLAADSLPELCTLSPGVDTWSVERDRFYNLVVTGNLLV